MIRISCRRIKMVIILVIVLMCYFKGFQEKRTLVYFHHQDPIVIWELLDNFSKDLKMHPRLESWQILHEEVSKMGGSKHTLIYKIIAHKRMTGDILFGISPIHGEVIIQEFDLKEKTFFIDEVLRSFSFRRIITGYEIFDNATSFSNDFTKFIEGHIEGISILRKELT